MKESDFEHSENSNDSHEEKLVPVAESIKYRKRAQEAEKQLEELNRKVEQISSENEKLNDRLSDVRLDNELTAGLTSAGIRDVEAGVLMARQRLANQQDKDVSEVISELRKEKGYLFDRVSTSAGAGLTASAKGIDTIGQGPLERAARRASESGSRVDLHEYMKVRRSFING
jgi:chromosome segregation ATPase